MTDDLREAVARAICCPEGCEVIGCRGRLYEREADAALAALGIPLATLAGLRDGSLVASDAAEITCLRAEVARLKAGVVAFGSIWAVEYARDYGFPPGHLHPTHYDILQNAGARMDSFTRAALAGEAAR